MTVTEPLLGKLESAVVLVDLHYSRDITLGEDCSRIRTTPACSPACAVSPLASSRPTKPTCSDRTAAAPVSQALENCSEYSLRHGVEQP